MKKQNNCILMIKDIVKKTGPCKGPVFVCEKVRDLARGQQVAGVFTLMYTCFAFVIYNY